ncbi:MAG: AAA family ATPase [Mogibacterium sp.]|nr:AAA family ATPase [Mogibacterium sp.]
MNNGIQLRISDLVYAVKKRWKLILFFTMAGLIVGIAASGVQYLQGSMSRNYRVTASAVFVTESSEGTYYEKMPYPVYNDILMAEEMSETVAYILQSNKLLNIVLSKSNLTGVKVSDIRNNLQISREGDTPILELTLNWRDSDEGIQIMTSILGNSTQILRDTLGTGKMSIIDQPASRRVAGGGMAAPLWGIMLLLGFWLGIGIVVLNLLMRPKVINLNDIPADIGLETLGVISKDDTFFNSDESLITRFPRARVRQQFASTAYIIMNRLGTAKDNHILYVTSSTRKEGRTSVACNLALQIAATEKNVLLIDFDTHNPEVGKSFMRSVEIEHSLNGLYRGDIEEQEAIVQINGYLDMMPMILELNPVPLDRSTFDLIEGITSRYDYVIIDAPPVGLASDTLSINQIADAAIMVVGFDMATKMDIRSSVEKLDKSGCKVLGCIVNQEQSLDNGSLIEDKSRKKRKNKEIGDGTLAKDVLSKSSGNGRKKRNNNKQSASYQMMTETLGKREEKTDDKEILEELIEFGLNEEDSEPASDE